MTMSEANASFRPPSGGDTKKRATPPTAKPRRSRSPQPPAPRPAWDGSIVDQSQFKLSPQEQVKKKQVFKSYTPASGRLGVSPSRRPGGGASDDESDGGWPAAPPVVLMRGGRRGSSTPKPTTTASDAASVASSSSSAPAPRSRRPSAVPAVDPQDAEIARFERERGRTGQPATASAATSRPSTPAPPPASGSASKKSVRTLRRALLFARQSMQGDAVEYVPADEEDEDGDDGEGDEMATDAVLDLASMTVVQTARQITLLDRQLATETDMRRRLEIQVQGLAHRLDEMQAQMQLGGMGPPRSSSLARGATALPPPVGGGIGGAGIEARLASLEAGHRAWVVDGHMKALDELFGAMGSAVAQDAV
ncbi:hypothetical protein H9P43_003638 [Blastocladiella emersonii ATCC 22665]|nr:hypothetical protein H9P43_003638 [Blastocladiella emersonii ATCC 22665]